MHSSDRSSRRDLLLEGCRCPRCGATLYRSRHRSAAETLLVVLLLAPCRCHNCYRRYWRFAPTNSLFYST